MLARVRSISLALLLVAPAALATGCEGKTSIGKSGPERWATTENTNVKIDWDKINEAYKLAEGPADFERRVNEIYEGEEIISIAVVDRDDRTQVVTGFFDKDGNGRVSDEAIDAALTAPAAPPAAAAVPATAEAAAPTVAAAPAPAVASAAGTPVTAKAEAAVPPTAAVPATVTAAVPATVVAAAPTAAPVAAAAPVPAATGTERETIFTITRTVGADGSAQVQTSGYGPYYGYHSPMLSIMGGMLMGSMMASMFMPTYMPMGAYATSPGRAGELRNQRAGYRAQNPGRFTKPSKTGKAYGGTPAGGSKGSTGRSRGGGRFGAVGTRPRRIAHLAA